MEGEKKNSLGLKTTKGSVYVCTANSHLAKRSLRISIRCCSMESKKGSALLSFTIFCTMLKTSPTSVLRVKDWYEKLKQCFIVNCSRVESIFSLWFHFFIYLSWSHWRTSDLCYCRCFMSCMIHIKQEPIISFHFSFHSHKGYSSSLLMSSSLWENSIMSSSLCSMNTFSWMSRASFLIPVSCYKFEKEGQNVQGRKAKGAKITRLRDTSKRRGNIQAKCNCLCVSNLKNHCQDN